MVPWCCCFCGGELRAEVLLAVVMWEDLQIFQSYYSHRVQWQLLSHGIVWRIWVLAVGWDTLG